MNERKTVEKVVGRMYRHYESIVGRTPDQKTVRAMEEKACKAAEIADKRKKRA